MLGSESCSKCVSWEVNHSTFTPRPPIVMCLMGSHWTLHCPWWGGGFMTMESSVCESVIVFETALRWVNQDKRHHHHLLQEDRIMFTCVELTSWTSYCCGSWASCSALSTTTPCCFRPATSISISPCGPVFCNRSLAFGPHYLSAWSPNTFTHFNLRQAFLTFLVLYMIYVTHFCESLKCWWVYQHMETLTSLQADGFLESPVTVCWKHFLCSVKNNWQV